jgi:GNAT superfamily N-acetyltransferase
MTTTLCCRAHRRVEALSAHFTGQAVAATHNCICRGSVVPEIVRGINYREISCSELGRHIRSIDRSETRRGSYKMVVDGQPSPVVTAQGVLTLDSTPDELPNWTDAQIASHLERIERCVANGGVIIGAFDTCAGHEVMVGLSVLDGKWIGDEVDTLDMYFLFATREMRGRGVGRTLIEKISAEAKARSAAALYISASHSQNTVNFYVRRGAVLATKVLGGHENSFGTPLAPGDPIRPDIQLIMPLVCDLLLLAPELYCPEHVGIIANAAVACRGDRIVWRGLASNLPKQLRISTTADRVRKFGVGTMLAPGLIDLHCHVDPTNLGGDPGDPNGGGGELSRYGLHPDREYLPRGVTTTLSQGDAGASTWNHYTAACRAAKLWSRCLMAMNILNAGELPEYFATHTDGEDLEDFDARACAAAMAQRGGCSAVGVWGVDINVGHNHGSH